MDINKLKELIDKEGRIAIAVGRDYGLDEMGAALALYLSFKNLGRDISIVSPKQPLVEVSNLVGIDKVKPEFESRGGDLIVSFPYREDEIGKVSYTVENGLLNIVVKPKEDQSLSFGEKDVLFKRAGDVPATLFTIGVKRLSDLREIFDIEALKDTTIVNIDKAADNEGYGDVVIISQNASSVSEQVTNLLLSLNYQLDLDISQNLLSGISQATQNFQSPRTSYMAFEMAGILMRNGAKRETRQQNQSQPNQQQRQQFQGQPQQRQGKKAPKDWLEPKIFTGSTNVE